MDTTKNLLLNLSLLLVLSFVFQIWFENRKIQERNEVFTRWYFITSILLCFILSFKVGDSFRFDLRQVPFILGGLYLRKGMPLLVLTIILLRGSFGISSGFLMTSTLYIILSIVIYFTKPWFQTQNRNGRLIYTALLSSGVSLVIMAGMDLFTVHRYENWIAFLIIPAVGNVIMAYMIETINKNNFIRQKVEQSLKVETVSHMSAAISHEIRNPLTVARGFLQLVTQNDSYGAKEREYLQIALQEMDRAEQVIRDYLTFAKPTIDNIVKVDVDKEMRHVLNVLQPTSNLNSVQVKTYINSFSYIQGDRNKFQQCMLNIIKNSLEAMSMGGTLTIQTSYINEKVNIKISDTGVGMTTEQINRLGEPYYSTKEGKGTGLGMMVVFSLISAMEGEIKIHSKVGKGTTFSITFPHYPADYPIALKYVSTAKEEQ